MSENYPGGWFGASWDAPVCDPVYHKPTPTGETCPYCTRDITADDQGLVIPYVGLHENRLEAWHLDCFLQSIGAPTS